MPVKIRGSFEDLFARIYQEGGRIVKDVNDALEAEAKQIQKTAKEYVPFEKGNMEDAIKLSSADRRRKWIVYVDDTMKDDTGKYTVGDYLNFLHEATYNYGPGTVAKGPKAGRKFLERALEDNRKQALTRIRKKVREAHKRRVGR